MHTYDIARRFHLNPSHWPISLKVAAGPVMVLGLLALMSYIGWSIADQHQRLISKNYEEHADYEETTLRLPHVLARIQRDLYKLTIWSQIDVEGPEVTSTLQSINDDLASVLDMLAKLNGQRSVERLKEAIERYSLGVEQALILIDRSPRVGATATRGVERAYLEADHAASILAESAKRLLDQQLQEAESSWQLLIIKFLVMIGAVGLLVPLIAIVSNRMIVSPIKNLATMVDQFRHGDFDVQIPWAARHDEIGLVARAMEAFRKNLIRNQILEREREELNQQLEWKVQQRTKELAEQKERLAQALKKEHKLNGLQRQFVSMVCHEFRTPLAIIDGNAQRIMKRRHTLSQDKLLGMLGKVRISVARLTELMESVLSASKLEAGSIEIDPTPCNLVALITEVASNYREVNPTYEISSDVTMLPERFIVDEKLIRQVVSNLISNAVKYSPDGTPINIEAKLCDNGGVQIAVCDRGVGIPEDELEKLFQRFFRATTSTGIAGTGIGLHMVKAIVDMHGGQIEVASQIGVGTTFTVYLPDRDGDETPDCDKIVKAA